ncbi:putative leader peptide [Streptomyces sp. KN37]|uniref:putative leader peptide n=1 Tax=Streptomyces sp. KN37 TaxID=3090667 RepID=UPI002A74EA55|nr:putative leader peptide [Streptomyces sp. KN37]WPO70963.1 putative leader peptide [Streptomyces sp. KN37]
MPGGPRTRPAVPSPSDRPLNPSRPHAEQELTAPGLHGLLRIVTDTDVRLWRRVHMDLVRYAGCVCHSSC